jgi:pseudouridine synthase
VAAERLQKLIARAGLCSRRRAEDMIRERRVTVNGKLAVLGDVADPDSDSVKVDGKRLKSPGVLRYILLYKPTGVVTTTDDPEGRTTILSLLRGKVSERVFPVGRLDYHSEGLVLLTNDGDLALKVAHPRYGVPREYLAKVRGVPDARAVEKLRRGAVLEGQRVVPKEVALVKPTTSGLNSWWRVVVGEGKTHEVRELFSRVGHPVQRLIRVAIGALHDDKLRPGAWRELAPAEVSALMERQGRQDDARTTGPGVHSQARGLRAGQADRGGAAGARGQRHRQAGLEREPPRHVAEGTRRHPGGPSRPAPVPRRGRVRPAKGPRRAPRG